MKNETNLIEKIKYWPLLTNQLLKQNIFVLTWPCSGLVLHCDLTPLVKARLFGDSLTDRLPLGLCVTFRTAAPLCFALFETPVTDELRLPATVTSQSLNVWLICIDEIVGTDNFLRGCVSWWVLVDVGEATPVDVIIPAFLTCCCCCCVAILLEEFVRLCFSCSLRDGERWNGWISVVVGDFAVKIESSMNEGGH